MLNAEKYEDVIIDAVEDTVIDDPICELHNARTGSYNCDNDCDACKRNVLRWLCQEYVKPILNEEEKRILLNIIKAFEPFGGELKCIAKYCCNDEPKEYYLNFSYRNHDDLDTFSFKDDELFVGMEVDKLYTLQELGL